MRNLIMGLATAGLILSLQVSSVFAFHCPLLVKECNAVVAKMEKKSGTDKTVVTQAKQGCAEALQLHKAGKHADSVIKAGEAIAMAGKSAK